MADWTLEDIEVLKNLYLNKFGPSHIAKELKDKFTTVAVDSQIRRLKNKGELPRLYNSAKPRNRQYSPRLFKGVGPEEEGAFADSRRRQRDIIACAWHLVDLKRAGMSPTRTELHITADAARPSFIPATPMGSFIGSCAAMCAESAG